MLDVGTSDEKQKIPHMPYFTVSRRPYSQSSIRLQNKPRNLIAEAKPIFNTRAHAPRLLS